LDKIYLIYFSATGNTKKILHQIAKGIGINNVVAIDFTLPFNRDYTNTYIADKNALVIFGAPVYMGRVQSTAAEYLKQFRGKNQPAVCIATYGNRAYEDALIELTDIIKEDGFLPIAGAAFIGEHSFSDRKVQIAVGRPDKNDFDIAFKFGESIAQKLDSHDLTEVHVQGNKPYLKPKKIPKMTPVKKQNCINCGTCKANCPVGAIDNNAVGDKNKCIVCMSCIKNCPYDAREMRNLILGIARKSLLKNPKKNPSLFI